jgi:hypothetical protein
MLRVQGSALQLKPMQSETALLRRLLQEQGTQLMAKRNPKTTAPFRETGDDPRLVTTIDYLRAVLRGIEELQTELVGGETVRQQRDAWRRLVETIQDEAHRALDYPTGISARRGPATTLQTIKDHWPGDGCRGFIAFHEPHGRLIVAEREYAVDRECHQLIFIRDNGDPVMLDEDFQQEDFKL